MIENPIEYKNKLLAKYDSKQITLEELQKECAYWYLDCFNEIVVRPYPTPPHRYSEYASMDYAEKKEVPNAFWFLPEIKNYLDAKFLVKNENKSQISRMKEFINYIPESDFVARSKYQQKINEFESKDFS